MEGHEVLSAVEMAFLESLVRNQTKDFSWGLASVKNVEAKRKRSQFEPCLDAPVDGCLVDELLIKGVQSRLKVAGDFCDVKGAPLCCVYLSILSSCCQQD